MEGYDLRLDVPARAFINAQLLSLLERGGTFWDAKKQLFSQDVYAQSGLSVYDYKLFDHSLAISLLFCTIVVPREFLDLPPNHRVYRDFDAERVSHFFTITQPTQVTSYLFLRCLRNSVAHALFSVSQSAGEAHYQFWTEREPILKATIGHGDLIRFVESVGKRLTNAVLEQKKEDSIETR